MMLFDDLCKTTSNDISLQLEITWKALITNYIKDTSNLNQNKRILQRNIQINNEMDHLSVQEMKEKLTVFDKELEDVYGKLKQAVMKYFEDVTRDEIVKFDYILDGICKIGHLLLSKSDKRPSSHKGKVFEFKALKSATFPGIRSSSKKYGNHQLHYFLTQKQMED